MKIPTNPSGPSPIPQEGPFDKGTAKRNTPAGKSPFPAQRPTDAPAAGAASRLTIPAGWQSAALGDPQKLDSMLRESMSQLVASSPVAARLNEVQRAQLEQHLAGDPVMRELLTQHLERSLV